MKPASTTSSTPRSSSQAAIAPSRCRPVRVARGLEDGRLDARAPRPARAPRTPGLLLATRDDLDAVAAVHRVEDRLEVRARARDQHRDRETVAVNPV